VYLSICKINNYSSILAGNKQKTSFVKGAMKRRRNECGNELKAFLVRPFCLGKWEAVLKLRKHFDQFFEVLCFVPQTCLFGKLRIRFAITCAQHSKNRRYFK
jgi:hypothetical protein